MNKTQKSDLITGTQKLIPSALIKTLYQHQTKCRLCKDEDTTIKDRVEDAIRRGGGLSTIAGKEGLPVKTVEDHAKYMKRLPTAVADETHDELVQVTALLPADDTFVVPVSSIRTIRNTLIPRLVQSLVAKAADPQQWQLSEGAVVLDMLVRLLKLVTVEPEEATGRMDDARQLAIGKLSELYNNAKTQEERTAIVAAQRKMAEAIADIKDLIVEGDFEVVVDE